jgi:hypothetical protein
MKSKEIITKLSTIVNKNNFLWFLIILLTATLFYMIGWINCKLEMKQPIRIENPENDSQDLQSFKF